MRIQHNIMAMNAYRNYNNNTSALSKNLEKLSSGYKINRAGDDAAGLAISEKMRAQITGLDKAQDNAKDGISLVQTAEGALTEVHDMLNRMVELATQSANGTYDNETDRANLQKEVEQLQSEIDRIADSANFNGIKLLDGSMATKNGAETVSTIISGTSADVTAAGGVAYTQTLKLSAGTSGTEQVLSFRYLDENGAIQEGKITFTAGASATATGDAAETELQAALGDGYTVTNNAGTLTIAAAEKSSKHIQLLSASQTNDGADATVTLGTATVGKDDVFTINGASINDITKDNALVIDGQTYQIVTRGEEVDSDAKALYLDKASAGALNADDVAQLVQQLKDYGVTASVGTTKTNIVISQAVEGDKAEGGLTLQIGDTSDSYNQLKVSVQDMHTAALGIAGVNIGTQEGAQSAVDIIKKAINTVSSVRGDLGATQNRLDHTINNLSVMQENIQDAESSIRDTDVADEMMAYTKNNILIQSAQAMLAQANQVPQGVLQLLQ